MQVQTYENEVERHPEACEEARALIEQLGLEGQSRTVSPDGTRSPYRVWTETEHRVFSILLPTHEQVERYEAESIPLRVLQVLAHAKGTGMFERFEVWHNANPAVKDPVLVGVPKGGYWNPSQWFILARWGEELDEMPALIEKAAKINVQRVREAAVTGIAKLNGLLATLDATPASIALKVPSILDLD